MINHSEMFDWLNEYILYKNDGVGSLKKEKEMKREIETERENDGESVYLCKYGIRFVIRSNK